MTKKQFKQFIKEAKDRAYEICNEDYDLNPQIKIQDYLVRVFSHREVEAQDVIWEHERWGIDKKDPELNAYWRGSYAAHRAAIYYTKHLKRELEWIERGMICGK